LQPDDQLNCLIVQPAFSSKNYWHYVKVAKSLDAHAVAPPLGLLTVAAILPQHWRFRLVDLNVKDLVEDDWEFADLICVGGMLPQQPGILRVIQEANSRGVYVAVGGADPTSQPDVYADADALVLGEGEVSIPMWLDSWRDGNRFGQFHSVERPAVTNTPPPRFDLIDFKDYVHVGVQFSRGCPFNCEFCDIIELFGRVPRSKTTEQILAELDMLYDMGYRGWVDLVDDNFIGNKRQVKPMLVALKKWSEERNYPFYFSTEATMNLADDDDLLNKMRDVDFRFVFMGIETPDPKLLSLTQKRVNAMKPIADRVNKIYDYGISVTAGFIFGFDEEKTGNDDVMIACIEETGIVIAMVGLLVALPNTQLTRRLQREGRLLSDEKHVFDGQDRTYQIVTVGQNTDGEDNQAAELNFVTSRDRVEIYREYKRVIETIYDAKVFFDRILSTALRLKLVGKHRPRGWEARRDLRAFLRVAWWMTKNKSTRWLYWRNTLRTLFLGQAKVQFCQSMMALFMHYEGQSRYTARQMDENINHAINHAKFPRQVSEMPMLALPIVDPNLPVSKELA